ncbi:MAG: HAMP domain-containing sensor histidine kinase [Pseudoxanthomonas sp.]
MSESRPRTSLRRRIVRWLFVLAAAVTAAIIAQGLAVNEHVERIVWKSLLTVELDHFIQRSREEPEYRWDDTLGFVVYDEARDPLPPALRGLAPGLHDDVELGGKMHVVLVRDVDGHRYLMATDIEEFDRNENKYNLLIIVPAILSLLALGAVMAWSMRRLLQPLSRLAQRVGALRPEQSGQRIPIDDDAGSELVVIAEAFNDYLQRNERFVQRERAFIDSASHELRTPISVIAGASGLALEQDGVPEAARKQMLRVHRAARDVEQLVSLLLVLAKEPSRLAASSDRLALEELLPDIVDDHRRLTGNKDLSLRLEEPLPACEIVAPMPIVQAAIGNLVRNAIENSDRGEIRVRLQADATVTIDDPGHGMSPEEISRLYAQVARGGRDGGGIGLALISRLCEHLGWRLEFSPSPGGGTRTTLRLQPAARA